MGLPLARVGKRGVRLTGVGNVAAGTRLAVYGLAWIGHFCFEGNRPATWGYPWWSLRAEWRMFGLAITGKLKEQLPK